MSVAKKKLHDTAGNTAKFLLTKQAEDFADSHRVKIVIVGSGYTGVAVGIAVLFKVRWKRCNSYPNLALPIARASRRERLDGEDGDRVLRERYKHSRSWESSKLSRPLSRSDPSEGTRVLKRKERDTCAPEENHRRLGSYLKGLPRVPDKGPKAQRTGPT